ncbi:MAG: penicillin acylase family protein, partial [Phycisphaerales bacterium]|nr:penicillin acylase family protein [Phycisphaerales bacterium]
MTQERDISGAQTLAVGGLSEPVEIRKDRWGMTHIRAATRDDLFFAQGFNIASERLWQIDLWRKKGLGRMAADFGPGFLMQDHATRHFVYRGEMAPEWASYAPDAEEICTAFARGINAYIDRVLAGEAPLPVEFQRFGTRPAHWAPEDVVRPRTHCLIRNAISEVQRAYTLSHSGRKAEALRKHLEPPVTPTTAADLDLGTIPLAAVTRYQLAVAPPGLTPERLAAHMDEAGKWATTSAAGEVVLATDNEGSNNWALAGAITETGRPILASDPHRVHSVPSLRYMVHLTAPGIDVTGGGDPAMPGVIIGHSDFAAFCLTTYGADQQDVYVYELAPGDPLSYRYGEGWEKMEVVEEVFEVKGHDPVTLPLHFTRHGPVMLEEPEKNRAYAIRSVWSDAGTSPYMAGLSVMRARSVEEYRKALVGWGAPTMNHMWADIEGNIVWQSAGWSPVRPNWEGLLPV